MRRAITVLSQRDAARAEGRAHRERLKVLRENLRRAIAERKIRMKDFTNLARTERLAVRAQLSEAHSQLLRDLSVKMRAARAAAKVAHVARMAQVKHIYDSAVDAARAALEAERLHQAEHVRISKEEERQRNEIHKAHARVLAEPPAAAVGTSSALGTFGPLFDKIGHKVKANPGESKMEALLRHVETHPEEAHAVLEPAKEQAIAKTRAEIAAVERAASVTPGAKPQLSLVKGFGGKLAANTFAARALPSPRAASPTAAPLPEKKVTPPVAVAPEKSVKAPDEHDTAKLAKMIRADIQSAVHAGRLPKKAKYSVTTSKYSMGSSITVVVSKLPFRVLNPAAYRVQKGSIYAEFDRTFPSRYTPEAEKLLADVNAIIDAYHWDRSDLASDYHHSRFHRDVKFGDSHKEWEAIDAAKKAGDDSLLFAPATTVETSKKATRPTKSHAKAPAPAVKEKPRRKGELPRGSGGMLLSDLLRERAELAAAKAARVAIRAKAEAPAARAPNAYEAKRAARVERMKTKATKLRAEAQGAFAREHAVGDRIPMGQPILVGHHSEKKHRRDIKKMDALARKGVALTKAAESMERRASSAEKNRAIFSDDPDAIPKLRAQLAAIERNRARMRAANEAIRTGGDAVAALRAQGFSEKTARALTEKVAMGHVGFPPYKFQNAGAEYTRIKKRIAELEARASSPARPSEIIGEVSLSEADNRVRVVFPGKPPEATRTALKEAGFRWAPSLGVWQRHASVGAWSDARRIATLHSSKLTS